MLRRSHRFTASSGIGQLAEAVNSGESKGIEQVWQRGYVDLHKHDLRAINDAEFDAIILGSASEQDGGGERKGYAHYLSVMAREEPPINASSTDFDVWARQVLAAHSQFQILSALRNGPYGVTGLNQRISESLSKHKLIASSLLWYQGRPVLVTRNDYRLGLMNGDIGITLRYPRVDKVSGELSWVTRVAFPKSDGSNGIHWVLPSRLQATETVFALTVHKSQGSEFEHCALILPPFRNPVLTRELVYTGITRAKKWFSLVNLGNPKMIFEAAAQRVQRAGGLFVSEKT
jgi:exodeoxyribonuclease V alpha subunit